MRKKSNCIYPVEVTNSLDVCYWHKTDITADIKEDLMSAVDQKTDFVI